MKHISILVPQGHTSVVNIEGSLQILSEVNGFLAHLGRPPLFTIELVGIARDNTQRNGLFSIRPDKLVKEVTKTDLIIIPAMHGDQHQALEQNKDFIPWIVDQYNRGAELAAFCIGAFFLAGTGLMKGKQCATHWKLANEFRSMFPDVNLVDDKIMTGEDGIYTSGGAYSWLNLTLYLIEKYAGREVAILASKAYMIDIDRTSQSPFIMFEGQKTHEDEPIKKAQEYIEQNFEEKITVDRLAAMFALGRRNLERRFKKATSNTVVEYIQRVKIEVAKKGLETSRKSVNELMYDVGYNDTKAFRTVFKRVTGLSPIEYRNKYNKHAILAQEA
ncbi:GlxA family transcriptional regulator [Chitinophaga sp. 22620]|uniref:GlxA family transcriptional regulator n=1 Tax=Chitinophaga sp. 22620 TaxID=3453952 RepID=UPI003F878E30